MSPLLKRTWQWLLREANNAPGAWMMSDDPDWRLKGPRSFSNPPPSRRAGYRPPAKDTIITMYVIPREAYLRVHRQRLKRQRREERR